MQHITNLKLISQGDNSQFMVTICNIIFKWVKGNVATLFDYLQINLMMWLFTFLYSINSFTIVKFAFERTPERFLILLSHFQFVKKYY